MCTFICQVSPLTSSCQFSTFHQCSLIPQASLSFILHPFIKLPWGSSLILLKTSSDWSKGFSSCYHSKMGKHIAKSSSLTGHSFLQGLVLGKITTYFVTCDPNMLTVSNCNLDIRGFRLFGSGAP